MSADLGKDLGVELAKPQARDLGVVPFPTFADAVYANADPDRYWWDPNNNVLGGPYAANVPPIEQISGEDFYSSFSAAVEACGHTEDFNYWSVIGGARIGYAERRPAGDVDREWRGLASDATGQYLLAGSYSVVATLGRLWTSDDYGVTWTERRPAGDTDQYWRGFASDATGQYLLAANNVRAYTSDDYGVSWSETRPAGDLDKGWFAAASDATGQYLLLGVDTGRLYTSDDYGATWTERQPAGAADFRWLKAASDATGQYLIASAYGGRLWTSDDYGVTWTERRPAGDAGKNWYGVASDSIGKYLVACIDGARFYVSDDYGVTWTERNPAAVQNYNWSDVCISASGQYLTAGHVTRLYSSGDFGVTWNEVRPVGDADKVWRSVACDASGRRVIAGDTLRLYTRVVDTAPDTAKLADVITFTAAAGDGIGIALGTVTDDTDQTGAVFARSDTGTHNIRLAFVEKDGTVTYSANILLTTSYQRVDTTVDIDAGGTTPEIRIVNGSDALAGAVHVWGAAVYKDKAFPWSYRTNETGANQAQAKDVLYFPSAVVPAAIKSGTWAHKTVPFWADSEIAAGDYAVFCRMATTNDAAYLFGSDDKVYVKEAGVEKVQSEAVNTVRYAVLTNTYNAVVGSATLAGYSVGDGTYGSSPWSWAAGENWYYGMNHTSAFQANGLIGLPEAA